MTMFNERTPFEKVTVILGFIAAAGLCLFLLHCAVTDAIKRNPKHVQLLLKDFEYERLMTEGKSTAIVLSDTFHVGEPVNAARTMKGPVIRITVTEKKKIASKELLKQKNREYLKGASRKSKKATSKLIKKHTTDSLVLLNYTLTDKNPSND